MLWIGITGSIGTGKSTFSNFLRKNGQIVLDADELAKSCLEPGGSAYSKVIQAFGPLIVDETGQINRAALAKDVFSDKRKLETLEAIIHPEVRIAVENAKAEYKNKKQKFLFYDVPLLFEKNMEKSFELIVMVTSTLENQMDRIKKRNKWTDQEIKNRVAAQLSPADKESKAHVLIHNDKDLTQLEDEAKKFLKWLESIY